MSLSASDLYSRELLVRMEAEHIRGRWPEAWLSDPSVPSETKTKTRNERERADHLDQVGDILSGLQADWGRLGPMVRDGYMRQVAEFEAHKARHEDVEDAA